MRTFLSFGVLRSLVLLVAFMVIDPSSAYGQLIGTSDNTFSRSLYGSADETFHRSHARKAVGVSTDVVLIAMPVATLAGVLIMQDWTGLKQGALAGVTSIGAMMLLKYTVREKRPDGSNYHSFPSGHTSCMFTNATFLQRRYGWKFGVPAYALATYVGWGRVYAKKHHWWDVVVGAALGAGASLIYTRPFAEKHELMIEPSATPGGVNVTASLVF